MSRVHATHERVSSLALFPSFVFRYLFSWLFGRVVAREWKAGGRNGAKTDRRHAAETHAGNGHGRRPEFGDRQGDKEMDGSTHGRAVSGRENDRFRKKKRGGGRDRL